MLQAPPLPYPSPMSQGLPSAPGELQEGAGFWGKSLGWLLTAPPPRSSPTSTVGEKNKIKPESGLVTFPQTRPRLGEQCRAWRAVFALAVLEAALPPQHVCGSSSRAQVSAAFPVSSPRLLWLSPAPQPLPTRLAPGCFSPPSVAAVLPGAWGCRHPPLLLPRPLAPQPGRPQIWETHRGLAW